MGSCMGHHMGLYDMYDMYDMCVSTERECVRAQSVCMNECSGLYVPPTLKIIDMMVYNVIGRLDDWTYVCLRQLRPVTWMDCRSVWFGTFTAISWEKTPLRTWSGWKLTVTSCVSPAAIDASGGAHVNTSWLS